MAKQSITKKEAIEHISEQTGLTKKDAQASCETLLEFIKDNLKEGKKVNFTGFGLFEVRERSARSGRNPQTGEKIDIPAHQTPAFKPGKFLRDAVRNK